MIRPKLLFFISVILFSLPFLPDCVRQAGGESRWGYLFSQPVQLEWARRYDDSLHKQDYNYGIALDDSGNIYVTGLTNAAGDSATGTITTIKYSPDGTQQWVANYQGNGGNYINGNGIISDHEGNVYISTTNGNIFSGAVNFLLLKYNTVGVLQWAKYYGDNVNSYEAEDIILDRNGNIYQVGYTNAIPGYIMIQIVKYNNNGDTLWTQKYGYTGWTRTFGGFLAIDSLNNLIIVGSGQVNISSSPHALTLKYNSSGNFLWASQYAASSNSYDNLFKVGVDYLNNIYVVGETANNSTGYLTIKYNSSGNQQWVRKYLGTAINGVSTANSLAIDAQSNVYVTGMVQDSGGIGPINTDIGTIKYNSNGDSLWIRIYDGYGYADGGIDISLDNLGNIYVNGYVDSSSNFEYITTIKYNNNGTQIWITKYPGGLNQLVKSILIDNYNCVYVAGQNDLHSTGSDYITLKYSQLMGIKPIVHSKPKIYNLYQNYPNPFNSQTNIIYELYQRSFIKLEIYDIIGKFINNLVNEEQEAGKYNIKWDANNYSSGIYFFKLSAIGGANDFSETKKLILIK